MPKANDGQTRGLNDDFGFEFEFDCVVVGSGHAGSCAALAAKDAGCTRVLMIDKCPEAWVGGNGYFTAGAHRTAHSGLADLLPLLTNASPSLQPSAAQLSTIDVEPYTPADFASDIQRLGAGRADPGLVKTVVDDSREAVGWLSEQVRVPFVLSFNRQAYEVGGRMKFWGGMALSVEEGGKGLIGAHRRRLREAGVEVWFEARAVEILMVEQTEEKVVCGVEVKVGGRDVRVRTPSVVLAAGGFEANKEMRAKYLGGEWVHARVRGTPYNTGDGFELARAVGAKMTGDWEGCHSTAWDAHAAFDGGERELTNQYTKSGYPLGIMVNVHGKRFVDEGEDFRNYTYAKFGRAILQQPGGCAFQVWDRKVLDRLRKEEYGDDVVKKAWAQSAEELADVLGMEEWGLEDKKQFVETIREFNDAVRKAASGPDTPEWNPAVKDGRTTESEDATLPVPKTNWALTIEEAPLMAVKVACGVTFTFGGLAIDPDTAGVLSAATENVIPGLFCTGEIVGGLFYGNYPGGSGLTAGAIFGRKAGAGAGKREGSVVHKRPASQPKRL
ncbi:FAD/NAD-P-binding domain-containing protein [Flammula alnicola]|nr:FAD/NAD-P-binding domain-containing protein [Flammula alnicola]